MFRHESTHKWTEPCVTVPTVRRTRRVLQLNVNDQNLYSSKICEQNFRRDWDHYRGTYRLVPDSEYLSIFNSVEALLVHRGLMQGRPLYERIATTGNATGHYLQYRHKSDNAHLQFGSWIFFFQENQNSYQDFLIRPQTRQSTLTPLDVVDSTLFAVNNSVVRLIQMSTV